MYVVDLSWSGTGVDVSFDGRNYVALHCAALAMF